MNASLYTEPIALHFKSAYGRLGINEWRTKKCLVSRSSTQKHWNCVWQVVILCGLQQQQKSILEYGSHRPDGNGLMHSFSVKVAATAAAAAANAIIFVFLHCI